jgi:predicted O-methyltransferase YrrM
MDSMPQRELEYPTYSSDWFSPHVDSWTSLFSSFQPSKILEIGSYEGRSTCFMIRKLGAFHNLEIHCVDHFQGSAEHKLDGFEHANIPINLNELKQRFLTNTRISVEKAPNEIDLHVHERKSINALCFLLAIKKQEYFDFIYIDGSHEAADVMVDAVLSFHLLRVGGVMCFDDYNWMGDPSRSPDLIGIPKLAIDSFLSIFLRKIEILDFPIRQIFIRKTAS